MPGRWQSRRGILSRNTVIVVLKYGALAAAGGAIGGPVGNYLYAHGPQLRALAQAMGDDACFWAKAVFSTFKGQYELAIGLAREATTFGAVQLPRRNGKGGTLYPPETQKPPLARGLFGGKWRG